MLYSDGFYLVCDEPLTEVRGASGEPEYVKLADLAARLGLSPHEPPYGIRDSYRFTSRRKYLRALMMGVNPTPTEIILQFLAEGSIPVQRSIYGEKHPITFYRE